MVRHFKKVERRHDWCLILHFICFILPLTPKVAFHTIYNFSTPSNSVLIEILHAGANCLSRLQCTLNFYVYALRDDRFRKAYVFFFREVFTIILISYSELIDSYFAFKLLQMKRKMMDNTQPNKTIPLAVYINDMKTFKKSVIRMIDEDSSELHIIMFTFSC